MRFDTILREVASLLREKGVRWALVGGLAVSARTEPRFTRDVDLALSAPAEIERARAAVALISDRGYHRGKDLRAGFEQLLQTGG